MSAPRHVTFTAPAAEGPSGLRGRKRKAGDQARTSGDKAEEQEFHAKAIEQAHAHLNTKSGGKIVIPQKRWYRQRAHSNPFSDHMLE